MNKLSPFRSDATRASYLAKYDEVLKTWPVPYRERDVQTRFGATHVIESGALELPPLLLFHGAGTTALLWQPIIEELSRHYRCYAVDTIIDPNKSIQIAPVRSNADLVDWMKELMDGLGVERARVAGLSFGGWLSSLLVLHCPQRVSHSVWMAPGGTIGALSVGFWLRLLPAVILRSSVQLRKALRWMAVKPESLQHPTMDLIALGPEVARAFRPGMVIPNVFTDDELRQISVPITLLVGAQEVIYKQGPIAVSERAKRLIPNVRVHVLEQASHLLPLDCPATLTKHILEGLSG